jgi:SPOR domain
MKGLNKTTMIGLSVVALGIAGNFFYKQYTTSDTVKLAKLSEQTDSLLLQNNMLSAEKMTDTAIISLTDSYLPPNMRKDEKPTVEKIEKAEPIEQPTKIQQPIVAVINNPTAKKVDKPTMAVVADRPIKDKMEKPMAVAATEKETLPTASESHEIVSSKAVNESKFYVVVGTYQSEENAQLELKKEPNKQLTVLKDGKFFRIIKGSFSQKNEANNAAKSLNTEGVSCFVIQR